jgi:4,5-DOPA dioxygenase extradiol
MGSGNIVHNIRRMDWNKKDAGYAWAIEFNESIKQAIASRDYQRIINYKKLNGGKESVPTEEHFVPLLYVLALQRSGESAKFFTDLYDLGSFSMTSVLIN